MRTVPANYSRPLPYPQVEKALRGTIYDSYIRRILWEGILNPWDEDLPKWLNCPTPAPTTTSSGSSSGVGLLGMWESIYTATAKVAQMFMKDGVDINPDGPVVCPYFWATPIHKLNCDIIWPPALDELLANARFRAGFDSHSHEHDDDEEAEDEINGPTFPLLDLDKPEYAGVIEKQMIIEKLLAQGGIRLAGLLNYLFAHDKMGNSSPAPFLAVMAYNGIW